MDMNFVRNRITQLRIKRGISEYQLSYDLGHSKNYVHNIVNGHSQPSIKELLYLIDFLEVTPHDFFDEKQEYQNPVLAKKIMDEIRNMDDEDLETLLLVIRRFKQS